MATRGGKLASNRSTLLQLSEEIDSIILNTNTRLHTSEDWSRDYKEFKRPQDPTPGGLQRLATQLEELKHEMKAQEALKDREVWELKAKLREREGLENTVKEQELKVKRYELEVNTLKAHISQKDRVLDSKNTEIDRLRSIASRCKTQIDKLQTLDMTYQTAQDNLAAEAEAKGKLVAGLKGENKSLKAAAASLKQELASVLGQMEELQEVNKQLQRKIERVKEEHAYDIERLRQLYSDELRKAEGEWKLVEDLRLKIAREDAERRALRDISLGPSRDASRIASLSASPVASKQKSPKGLRDSQSSIVTLGDHEDIRTFEQQITETTRRLDNLEARLSQADDVSRLSSSPATFGRSLQGYRRSKPSLF